MPSSSQETTLAAQSDLSEIETLRRQVVRLAASLGLKLVDPSVATVEDSADSDVGYGKSARGNRDGAFHTPDRMSVAMAWIFARNARDKALGADLFADPVWNMILDLYVNPCRHVPVAVTDLCLASQSPATTALRWLAIMEQRNLILRAPDKRDRRRSFVIFTDEGLRQVERALDMAAESDRRLGLGRLRAIQNVDNQL
ncbi:hypothetical protein LWE61_01575 [Sphingobium sufflavum]|uniref:hypothetical protein n=1 Tax=Sphingobium sufflavum TaxID=1129547 RepID=UPI001F45F130|nr:hypothetical protein [Sphingobium sufflavum]MCE7795240.1 hypothetical protein [Sphingobium sufflavum]